MKLRKNHFLIGLLLISTNLIQGQSLAWNEIIKGESSLFRKLNIKISETYKNNKLFRKAVYDKVSNETTYLNGNLDTLYILGYDKKDRINKITHNKESLKLKYNIEGNLIKEMSISSNTIPICTLRITSFPYKNRLDIYTNEVYYINSLKGDTLYKNVRTFVLNEADSTWNYNLEIIDSVSTKRYIYQRTTTITTTHKNYYSFDSIVNLERNKNNFYLSKVYPDSILLSIQTDSSIFYKIIKGKLSHKIASSRKLQPAYEVYYNEDSSVNQKVLYKYIPDVNGKEVLWELLYYNNEGKKIKSVFPNKKLYKLRGGKLKQKKFPETKMIMCRGMNLISIGRYEYKLWLISQSLFYDDSIEEYFSGNFPMNNYLINRFYNDKILKEDTEVFYEEWELSHDIKDTSKTWVDLGYQNKALLLRNKGAAIEDLDRYFIKIKLEDGSEKTSPLFNQSQVDSLRQKLHLVIFTFLKMTKY